jgi:hypothetical protein
MTQLRRLGARLQRVRAAISRCRRRIAAVSVLSACVLSVGFSGVALATTETYASGAGVYPGEELYDGNRPLHHPQLRAQPLR